MNTQTKIEEQRINELAEMRQRIAELEKANTERKQAEEALRKSEEQYRLLAENVTDVIWTMDMNLHFTYISPSVTRQRGYSVEEAMALGMERSLTPASLEVAAKVILEGLSAEMEGQKDLSRTWTVELEMYCKDGSTIWTEMEATFLRDPDGQAVGVLGVARDITERKKAEEALQHSEQYFRALIENAQDAIVIMNSDATIRYESPSMERMTGRKVKARIGKNPFEFCHPDDITNVMEVFLQLLENKIAVAHTELRLQHKDGLWRTFEVVGNNLLDNPVVTGIVLNLRDITERKRTEEELRKHREHLEELVEERTKELQDAQERLVRTEKLAVIGQLAGGVSHELRNPLGAIKNTSYFLNIAIEQPEPEVKETLEILEKEVATSERIISSLLDFARPKPATLQNVHINEVIEESLYRVTVPENVEVVRHLDITLPIILADPGQLGQVFTNIILNAIQAMPEGGQLVIKSEVPGPKWVAVSFTDTGRGISEENMGKLFEPLFTTKAKGIGLGLAICRTMVEAHGGTIEVQSIEGKGSTFTISLPVGKKEKQ